MSVGPDRRTPGRARAPARCGACRRPGTPVDPAGRVRGPVPVRGRAVVSTAGRTAGPAPDRSRRARDRARRRRPAPATGAGAAAAVRVADNRRPGHVRRGAGGVPGRGPAVAPRLVPEDRGRGAGDRRRPDRAREHPVPYDGFDHRVTLVLILGAAVLLLDAGASWRSPRGGSLTPGGRRQRCR